MVPKAPVIDPVKWEDDDMSPLSLPLTAFADPGSRCFDESFFSVGDSSTTLKSHDLKLEVRYA